MDQGRESWAALAAIGLSAALAHGLQRRADEVRWAEPDRFDWDYVPSGGALRAASLGSHTLAADAMWVRAVLSMAEALEQPGGGGCRWLGAMLSGVAALDPGWPTVYYYGGGTLRLCGDLDGSDALYLAGMENVSSGFYTYWFPFCLAMNAYLYRQDPQQAAEYLDIAADAAARYPRAPTWYAALAQSFREEGGQVLVGLRYLEGELEAATTEAEREELGRKIDELVLELLSP